MAQGMVRIVINAIDKYSGVLTGLNQGLELASKGLRFFTGVAEASFRAVGAAVNLAQVGGAFQEQRNQFENLAKSYQVNAEEIIKTVKRTALNTITEFDAIDVATRALAAGFRGDDLQTSLSFIKRWTEATGESFKTVSETVFRSLSSGRFSVLRQMGLVIENGASFQDVVGAMREQLTRFGDSGFNAGDKIASLNASQDDFVRKIGQSINSSKLFQTALSTAETAVLRLVEAFDPRPITTFIDFIARQSLSFVGGLAESFPNIARVFKSVFELGSASAQDFATKSSQYIFNVLKAVAAVVEGIVQTITQSPIVDGVSTVVGAVIQTFGAIVKGVGAVVDNVVALFVAGFKKIAEFQGQFAERSPRLAKLIGIDAQSTQELLVDLDTIQGTVAGTVNDITKTFDGLDKGTNFLFNIPERFRGWKVDLSSVEEGLKSLNGEAEKLDFSGTDKALKGVEAAANAATKSVSQSFVTLASGQKVIFQSAERTSESLKETAATAKGVKAAADAATKAVGKQVAVNVSGLNTELKKIQETLKSGKIEIGGTVRSFTPEERDALVRRAKEINATLKDALTGEIKIDAVARSEAGDDVATSLAAVNWPSELQKLGEFLLTFALAKVKGERIPFALGVAT